MDLFAQTLEVHRKAIESGCVDAAKSARLIARKLSDDVDMLKRDAALKRKAGEVFRRVSDRRLIDVEAQAVQSEIAAAEAASKAKRIKALVRGKSGRKVASVVASEATPETILKAGRESGIGNLEGAGTLSEDQVRAARSIARIVEAVSSCQHARTQKLTGFSGDGSGDFIPAQIAEEHARFYLPWVRKMKWSRAHPNHLQFVLCIAADDVTLGRAKGQYRMGYDKAIALLRDGLDLFNEIKREAKRGKSCAQTNPQVL